MIRRTLRLVLVTFALTRVVAACLVGGPDSPQLNPQPLPPVSDEKGGGENPPASGTASSAGSSSGASSSSGSSSGGFEQSPAPNVPPSNVASDGGAEGGDR
jgi:hypothetical protein